MQNEDVASDAEPEAAVPPGMGETSKAAPQDFRARRRQLVQDDLARIAVRMFLDRGYDAVSVEEIAAGAGMSERSFFRYFTTKEAVLRRFRQSLALRLVKAFEERPDDESPLAALRSAYIETSHVPAQERPRVRALGRLLVSAGDVWAKDLGETIGDAAVVAELARRMGAHPEDLRPAVVAAAVSAAASTGWISWVRSAAAEDPGAVVAGAIDMLGLSG